MDRPETVTKRISVSRRTVVQTGLRLAYASPVIAASFEVSTLVANANGTVLSSDSAELAVTPVNQAPVAVAGSGVTVTDEDGDGVATVTLDGSASADPDGAIVSYLWTVSGEWLSDQAVATVQLPVGIHRVLLTVTDDKGDTGQDKVRVEVVAGQPTPTPTQDQPAAQETAAPALPPAPYQVEAVQKLTEVAITWKVQPESVPPYRVYRCLDDGTLDDGQPHTAEDIDKFPWELLQEVSDKLSYRDATAQVNIAYLYSVRAFDGANESDRSNIARITVQPVEAPPTDTPVAADTRTTMPPTEAPPADTPTPEPPPDTPTPVPAGQSETPTDTP